MTQTDWLSEERQALESRLAELNQSCASESGLQTWHHLDDRRRMVLQELRYHRELTEWEWLCCGHEFVGYRVGPNAPQVGSRLTRRTPA